MGPTIVWFRNDLRVHDNRALLAALRRGEPIIPLFVWSPQEEGDWQLGSASRWWLRRSLIALDKDLVGRGSGLIIQSGDSLGILKTTIEQTGADAVYFNRRYEPHAIEVDRRVSRELQNAGVTVETFNASLLIEPTQITSTSGNPFRVFTPYWKRCLTDLEGASIDPLDAPAAIPTVPRLRASSSIDDSDAGLEPQRHAGFDSNWTPGAAAALAKLNTFLSESLRTYAERRDILDVDATSSLSPHLHFGEISPRQVWSAVKQESNKSGDPLLVQACGAYLRQLGWREFSYHLLFHFPETTSQPLQTKFAHFPWRNDELALKGWKDGRTGFPIVDAGMRQLHQTGWISNRMRMIVASFLVKDLLIPWQEGARWFWETLVDADLANNTLGWQWVAGCGADAAPFFRVFNPLSQGEKFDPHGEYLRRWVPELGPLSTKFIHKPWMAPPSDLAAARITMGTTYPQPIVDHAMARRRALDALDQVRKKETDNEL